MLYRRWTAVLCFLLASVLLAGCGTTRSTDTSRSGTEQLLISDAVDRAVSDLNFRVLAGKSVFFDPQYIKVTNPVYNFDDNHYLISTLRQHLLASGCVLKDKREDAEIVVEARAGAVGTDRHDLLYGVPATNLGGVVQVPGAPAAIPEIPFAKRTTQRGVAKLAVFAYHRESGQPVWQSGVSQYSSNARNMWVLGIGPFQSGTIYNGTKFAGGDLANPLTGRHGRGDSPVWVAKQANFKEHEPGEAESAVAIASNTPPAATPNAAAPSKPAAPAAVTAAAPPPSASPPAATKQAASAPAAQPAAERTNYQEPVPQGRVIDAGRSDLPYGKP